MFQKVIELDEKSRRREMGAHYTSEENILKLINSLFLDDLKTEFEVSRHHKNTLFEFHKKLTTLKFLDPACGCGNFLVITYRELRLLELDVLKASIQFGANIENVFKTISVNVDQFSGIELDEFPAQIAQVAMWLIDHQMNIATGELLGEWFARIPLTKSANIRKGNALRIDWEEFCPPNQLNYIIGNPPFIGKSNQTAAQKEDMDFVTKGIKSAGVLDYVAGWYIKAAQYVSGSKIASISRDKKLFIDAEFSQSNSSAIAGGSIKTGSSVNANNSVIAGSTRNLDAMSQMLNQVQHDSGNVQMQNQVQNDNKIEDLFEYAQTADETARRNIKVGFVSTNSITQGEQVGVLWSVLFNFYKVKIHFAHRTFSWSNEAKGNAAVHCVIIGFAGFDTAEKRLFDYEHIKGEPTERKVKNINPYLVPGNDVCLKSISNPICNVPKMQSGSATRDGGFLVLSKIEKEELVKKRPESEKFFRRFISGDDFINNIERWCIWLKNVPPNEFREIPEFQERFKQVKTFRENSTRPGTKKMAALPYLFAEERQPNWDFVLIPKVSSENRKYIPIAYLDKSFVISDKTFVAPNTSIFHFGVLTSQMHMAWMRYTCGRLKSDYSYSNTLVYNNYPFPLTPSDTQKKKVEEAAQLVLDTRAKYPGSTLADLYDPVTMPPDLVKAHQALDKAVDLCYRPQAFGSELVRIEYLFGLYEQYTAPMFGGASVKGKKAK